MNYLKNLFLLLAFVAIGSTSYAQELGKTPPPNKMEKERIDWKTELNLTPQQSKKVKIINQKYHNQRQALRQTAGGDREKMRSEMQKIRKAQNADMATILDKDQLKRFHEIQKERPKPGPRGPRK